MVNITKETIKKLTQSPDHLPDRYALAYFLNEEPSVKIRDTYFTEMIKKNVHGLFGPTASSKVNLSPFSWSYIAYDSEFVPSERFITLRQFNGAIVEFGYSVKKLTLKKTKQTRLDLPTNGIFYVHLSSRGV
ncbi:7613_t:CDS:2 [Ambispora gerdemannii]|uniref:7613_t:CDS:1 n=1 Tax=Ambispora gerdemannii TaxID=144530 RepID=A0A9N9FLR2_9GLOM|nr:7613_t:CDS:2 [Ambispora gerdemannii]